MNSGEILECLCASVGPAVSRVQIFLLGQIVGLLYHCNTKVPVWFGSWHNAGRLDSFISGRSASAAQSVAHAGKYVIAGQAKYHDTPNRRDREYSVA